MALTSRDVMFIMRSQDYASRGVMGLAGSFNRLQRELVRIDETLKRDLATSQSNQTRAIQRNQEALRNIQQPLQKHNQALSSQNARLAENRVALRQAGDTRTAVSEAAIKGWQREAAHVQTAISNNRQQVQTLRNQANAIKTTDATRAAALNNHANALSRENSMLGANLGRINQQIDAIQRNGITRRQAIQQIDRQVAANRVLAASNREEMSEAVRNAQAIERSIKQRGDAERAAATQRAAQHRQQIQQFQQKIQKMQAVGVAAMMMGAVLLAAGAKGISAFSSMTREAADFQFEMARVMTQVDPSVHGLGISIDNLRRISHGVAREVPASMDTIGSSLFFIFSSMNVNLEESRVLLRGFAREAVSGNSSIEDAARSTIAIMNGMQMGVEELTRVQDFQFQTVRKGVITYDQLAHNIGKLIPSLKRSGQEIETGGAMLAFLTRNGLSAEMATTAAARSLELMADPRVVGRLERLGITVRDSTTGAFLPMVDVLQQMADVIGNLPAPERAERMLEIFGGAGYRIQARRFFDTVLPNMEQFQQHIRWQIDSAGSMERAYAIMFNEPVNQIELLGNKWTVLRQIIGEQFFPVLELVVDGIEKLLNWFESLSNTQRENLAQWIATASVVAAVGGAFLLFGGILTTVVAMISMVTTHIGVALGILGGIPVVIGLVVGALVYLLMNFDSLSDGISHFINTLGLTERQAEIAMSALVALGIGFLTLRTYALLANTSLKTVKATMLLLAKNPIILVLAGLAALATAILVVGRSTREANRLQGQYVDGLANLSDELMSSMDALHDYERLMRRSIDATSEQILKEKELYNVLINSNLNHRDFISNISAGADAHRAYLRVIDEEIHELWRLESTSQGLTSAQREQLNGLQDLRKEYVAMGQAAERARETQLRAWREMGGIEAEVAKYIMMLENAESWEKRHIASQRALVEVLMENKEAWEALDPEIREALIATGEFDGVLNEFNETVQETSRIVEALTNTFDTLTSVQAGWQRGLDEANALIQAHNDALDAGSDAALDSVDSLLGLTNGMVLWIAGLQEGEQTTQGVFESMAEIIAKNSEVMQGDSHLVMSAILEMGDAGPEAMRMLADADPEDFLEVLRQIRLHAALTSEEVQEHMETMMIGMEAIMEEHKDFPPAVMSEIMMDMVQIIHTNKDLTDEQVALLMNSMSTIIKNNQDITASEMNDVMLGMAATINSGSNLTDAEMASLMTGISSVIHEYSDLGPEQMTRIFASMVSIMQIHGMEGVDAFLDTLKNGTQELMPIMDNWQRGLNLSLNLNTANFDQRLDAARRGLRQISGQATNLGVVTWVNDGGLIPGRGPDKDTVLAALTRGEFVMRRKAVDDIGVDTLRALNAHGRLAMLNRGGPVTQSLSGPLNRTSASLNDGNPDLMARKLDELIRLLENREPINLSVTTKDDPQDFAKKSSAYLKARM